MHFLNKLRKHPLAIAFILPIIIMAIYFFAFRRVYPFGNGSLLTVDMGQQYIDFYAYFRQTVLGHPGQFLFGWNKDLGGDMIGVWAYYLMSPFNFLLVLFPKTQLDLGITIITLLKYGSAGLSMAYYLKRRGVKHDLLPVYGLAYALSGWMMANQLNLMWLDGVIMLPLVADGIDELFAKRPRRFVCALVVTLITNYYMAYMVCIFSCLYFVFCAAKSWPQRRQLFTSAWRFVYGSVLAAGSAAFLLLPTLFQITQSKGTYTVTAVHSRIEYPPLHLLSKLFSGSFNFNQMPSGLPNIFAGAVVFLGAVLYFIARSVPLRERAVALGITAFLILSLMYEPLDLFWHGMQFPVWYPYRFSFVVVFWLIILAARGLATVKDGINIPQMLVLGGLTVAASVYVYMNVHRFDYLSKQTVIMSGLFALLAIIILSTDYNHQLVGKLLILGFTIIDMGTNVALSLNQISFVTHSDYHTYTETLRRGVQKVQKRDQGTYRIGKTVLRTKNDAMQVGYMGEDQFNSMFEPAVPRFYANLGQPEGDGFVTYANGTLITDALLDTKYWLDQRPVSSKTLGNTLLPTLSTRPDMNDYEPIGHTKLLNIYKNQNALGLGFGASRRIDTIKLTPQSPISNQEAILAGLNGQSYTPYFSAITPSKIDLVNVHSKRGMVYGVAPKQKVASVTYHFKADNTDAFYLTVGGDFTGNVVNITLNGQPVHTYDTFRNPVVLNVTPRDMSKEQVLKFTFSKDISFADVALYELNDAKATAALANLKDEPLTNIKQTATSLSGNINITRRNQLLFTTIPQIPGWTVKVDGKKVSPKKALDMFITVPLTRGNHHITMRYVPPYLILGCTISIVSWGLAFLTLRRRYRPRHANK